MPQYLGDLGCEHVVFKNDEKTVAEIAAMNPRGVLVSPGPGAGPFLARLQSALQDAMLVETSAADR